MATNNFVMVNVGDVKDKTPNYISVEVREGLKNKKILFNSNKLQLAARQGKARKNDYRSCLGDDSSSLSKPLQFKIQEENTWKALNVRSAAKQSSKCVMNEMTASTSSVRSAAHCTNKGKMRRKLRPLFRKTYGKLTEEFCPICLDVKMRLARGWIKCPVCGFKRDWNYYSKTLEVLSNGN